MLLPSELVMIKYFRMLFNEISKPSLNDFLGSAGVLWVKRVSVLSAIIVSPILLADDYDTSCDAVGNVEPICGFQRPEDLAVMLGEKLLLVSEYGSLDGSKSGYLSSYRINDGAIERLYPTNSMTRIDSGNTWGAKNCPGPPGKEFSPHGLYHNALVAPDRLAVINHGGRESIELFEVTLSDGGLDAALTWRGCVLAPQGAWFNDVVRLPNGNFIASHMMDRGLAHDQLLGLESSKDATGYVLQWSRKTGWQKVSNSEGALPNGLEVSSDGKILFVNYYFGDKVIALELEGGRRLWEVDVLGPDNSSWGLDGTLLIASHQEDLAAVLHCSESGESFCPLKYAIIALNPASGEKTTLLTGGGAPFGGTTVAVQASNELFLGSFAGNRMAKRFIRSQEIAQ